MKNVAILLNTTFGFAHELMAGISHGWATHPDWDFILYQQDYPAPERLKEWNVDGIIGFFSDSMPVKPYLQLKVPILNVSATHVRAPVVTVNVDQRAVGREAAIHLLHTGVTTFGFTGFAASSSSRGRLAGFRAALNRHKLDCDVHWIEGSFDRWPAGFERWLAAMRWPAAILVASDAEARLLLSVCRRLTIRVPEDLVVLGVNNEQNICLTCRPTLSSIPIDFRHIGNVAATMMSDWLNGHAPRRRLVAFKPGHAIERGSTQRSQAMNDPLVADSMRLMRENLSCGIGVREIANACGVSQRTLEYHFRNALAQSPGNILQQLRVQATKDLLAHTGLALDEISRRIGFRSSQYMTTFFRKKTGKTPAAYRKENRFGARIATSDTA